MGQRFTKKFGAQCLAEFVGTLYLTEIVGCTAVNPYTGGNGAIGIGLGLGILIYSYGHISGGNFNPAVTLALLIRGAIDGYTAFFYFISQILGALIGAGIAALLSESTVKLTKGGSYGDGEAISAEIFFTFMLCLVVINTATTKANKNKPYYGFAIGATVTTGAYSVGNISGGAFNPAVATGLACLGQTGNILWLYWFGELLGSVFAGLSWYVINNEEASQEKNLNIRKLIDEERQRDSVYQQQQLTSDNQLNQVSNDEELVNVDTGKRVNDVDPESGPR